MCESSYGEIRASRQGDFVEVRGLSGAVYFPLGTEFLPDLAAALLDVMTGGELDELRRALKLDRQDEVAVRAGEAEEPPVEGLKS